MVYVIRKKYHLVPSKRSSQLGRASIKIASCCYKILAIPNISGNKKGKRKKQKKVSDQSMSSFSLARDGWVAEFYVVFNGTSVISGQ